MAKRTATSDLNHDNWDREDDPEEAGTFSRAPEELMKKRVIKVAKRRNPISSQADAEKGSAFESFAGFVKTPTTASSNNTFGFLTNLTNKNEAPVKTNGITEDENLDEYYAKLKGLNESVNKWINQHVTANPFINLQPIFKDYDKYFEEIEKNKNKPKESDKPAKKVQFSFVSSTPLIGTNTATTSASAFSLGNTPSTSTPKFSFTAAPTTTTFSFGSNAAAKSSNIVTSTSPTTGSDKPTFSFGNPPSSTPASGATFSFTSTVVKPANTETNEEDNDDDEPPKVHFTPVVEEGHIYTIRCKVFVKKNNAFGDRGVGNLYLKPVPNSEKVQLIVRADTNLGNLICNFILSEGIPMQRMGKKDVMLVCLPTPESQPPPVPMLLRVKSTEDADELLKVLQKHKK